MRCVAWIATPPAGGPVPVSHVLTGAPGVACETNLLWLVRLLQKSYTGSPVSPLIPFVPRWLGLICK